MRDQHLKKDMERLIEELSISWKVPDTRQEKPKVKKLEIFKTGLFLGALDQSSSALKPCVAGVLEQSGAALVAR